MRTSVKMGIAAAVLLGVGVAVAGTASAAAEEDPNKGKGLDDTGVRHGVQYEGCGHFELVDPDAIEAWGRSNALRFAKWALKMDELRADPEPAIIDAMGMLFPECPWPPPSSTTFGPERTGWAETMVLAKEAIANLDLAGGGPGDGSAAAGVVARALAFGLRGISMAGRRRR